MSAEDSVSATLNVEKCSVVLVDVVGTTTSIGFAKETLFPYVNKNAEEFLKSKWDEEVVKNAVKELKGEDEQLDLAAATKAVQELTEKDSDSKGLKALQGLMYGKGYEDGELKAHVFSDVPSCFESWAKVKKVAIYSTGSIESQKQLFSHTIEGDLTGHISSYFDQSVGPKTESESYKKISEQLEVKPEDIAFISDNVNEVKAAKAAGLTTALVAREGNEEIPKEVASEYTVISSFKDVILENPAKRKNEEETTPEAPPSKVAKTESAEETGAVEKNAQEKLEDSAMEVDSSSTEVKVENKATEEVAAKTEKTETDSTEKTKTEKATESVSGKDETPMDTAVEKPVESAETKQESKTEETKEETENAEKKNEKETSSEKSQEELVKEESENKSNEAEACVANEEKDEEKLKEQVDGKTTSEATEEIKDCVTESNVEDKVVEQNAVTNGDKTETKSETEEVKATEEAQKPEKETEQEVEKKNGVDSTDNEETKTNSKDKDCPKSEDKTDAVVKQNGDTKDAKTEEKSTSEEKPKNTEEKENISDLANVVENGKTDEPAVANGNAEGKLNGGTIQEADSAIEEIKVKKIEAVPETAPSVSVEV